MTISNNNSDQNINDQKFNEQGFTISTNKALLDIDLIYNFLVNSYWAAGIDLEIVKRSIEHSLCFGLYFNKQQIGFARVITDYATFGYLADVFVLEAYRGQGLSKWLMHNIMHHADLQGFRRWMLATRDAHGLYAQSGFKAMQSPERFMEIVNPYK